MTLRIRNRLLKMILAMGTLLPLLSVANFILFILKKDEYEYRFSSFLNEQSIIFFYVFLFILSILIYVSVGITYHRFRMIMSNEVFFHILSIFVLLFINLKSVFLNYSILSIPDFYFAYGMKIFYGVILLVPLYSFCGVFFSIGIENSRFDIIFYVLLVGFAFVASLIPIDTFTVGVGVFYRSSFLIYIYGIFVILEVLTAILYLADNKRNSRKDNIALMLIQLLFSFSFLFLYMFNNVIFIVIFSILYFISYFLYVKILHNIYLWR